jgi:hypothetical protein
MENNTIHYIYSMQGLHTLCGIKVEYVNTNPPEYTHRFVIGADSIDFNCEECRKVYEDETILNLDNLTKCLEKIGYSIKGLQPNRFIFNHRNENIRIRVWEDSLEVQGEHTKVHTSIYFNRARVRMIDDCCVSVGEESTFVNLYNFDIKKI